MMLSLSKITCTVSATEAPPSMVRFNGDIIRDFLNGMGFNLHKELIPDDPDIRSQVLAKLDELGLPTEDFQRLEYLFRISCEFAGMVHENRPMVFKVYIAVYTLLCLGVDDLFLNSTEMRTFTLKMTRGEAQGHPHLDCLVKHLTTETPKYFGDFGTSIIISSTIDAMNGFVLENAFPKGFPKVVPGFASWNRSKNGYGEAYSFFIFPKEQFPESEYLGLYIQSMASLRDMASYINDILSFYKECVVGKEICFISNLAEEKGCSLVSALTDTCEFVLEQNAKIRKAFSGNQKLLDAYDHCMGGFLEWHFHGTRYRMNEIGLTLGPEPKVQNYESQT